MMLKLITNNERSSRSAVSVTVSVQLTLEQVEAIEAALEFACNSRLEDFERDRKSCEVEALKQAIVAARDVKRFNNAAIHLDAILRSSTGT
jgi:hypothetical protein